MRCWCWNEGEAVKSLEVQGGGGRGAEPAPDHCEDAAMVQFFYKHVPAGKGGAFMRIESRTFHFDTPSWLGHTPSTLCL
jgi:hypothetical protein